MDMAGDVSIQLMATDPNLNPLESIIKRGKKKIVSGFGISGYLAGTCPER